MSDIPHLGLIDEGKPLFPSVTHSDTRGSNNKILASAAAQWVRFLPSRHQINYTILISKLVCGNNRKRFEKHSSITIFLFLYGEMHSSDVFPHCTVPVLRLGI